MPVWSLGQSQNLRGWRKFSFPPWTSHQFHVLSWETHPITSCSCLHWLLCGPGAQLSSQDLPSSPHREAFNGIFFLGFLLYCAKAYSPQKTKSTMFESWLSENTFILSLPWIGFQIKKCFSSSILKASLNFLVIANVAFEQSNPFLISDPFYVTFFSFWNLLGFFLYPWCFENSQWCPWSELFFMCVCVRAHGCFFIVLANAMIFFIQTRSQSNILILERTW